MTADPIDYAAELRRVRTEQGLPPEVPQSARDAVAAILAGQAPQPTEQTADAK